MSSKAKEEWLAESISLCLVWFPSIDFSLVLVLLISLPLDCSRAFWQARATTALDASGVMRLQPLNKARAMT